MKNYKHFLIIFTVVILIFGSIFGFNFWFKNLTDSVSENNSFLGSFFKNTKSLLPESSEKKILENQSFLADNKGKQLTNFLAQKRLNLGFISSSRFDDFNENFPLKNPEKNQTLTQQPLWQPKPLSEIITPVSSPKATGTLLWPELKIETVLEYARFSDFYDPNDDGTINFSSPKNTFLSQSSIQNKLKNSVAHLPFSPLPGEIGNSYIVGSSQRFLDENLEGKNSADGIFFELQNKAKIGDKFEITDHRSRKLSFKVFDIITILESDLETAYQNFDRRVVTLQTTIFEGQIPTKRFLILAELVT